MTLWTQRPQCFPNLAKTLGIMQVKTDRSISDKESVRIGAAKLIEKYNAIVQSDSDKKVYWGPYHPIEKVINDYNPSYEYQREVIEIFKIILSEYYPEMNKKMQEEHRKRMEELGPQSL
ncbi:MAG: hypothetical protein A2X56_11250 [Nitrospirae bacterium GWC2_57_13]|nr:MAG: hypothetical protein A2X56_11250 [Nitrospirae bacterium GWC2_57_13]